LEKTHVAEDMEIGPAVGTPLVSVAAALLPGVAQSGSPYAPLPMIDE
jgi:hypothetical protein